MGQRATRYEINLESGRTLHAFHREERGVLGLECIEVQADGKARLWRRVSPYRFEPTDAVFPGFVSAARAVYVDHGIEINWSCPNGSATCSNANAEQRAGDGSVCVECVSDQAAV